MRKPALALLALAALPACGGKVVVTGSKQFPESRILGEILRQILLEEGIPAEHRAGLGGTLVLWEALQSGEVDACVEYSGTLLHQILREPGLDAAALEARLEGGGLKVLARPGFENNYALGMPRRRAEELGIRRISDLRRHPDLRFGFSSEFLAREDGWPGLRERCALEAAEVRGLDHEVALRAAAAGEIDVLDLYTTDAAIEAWDLRALEDDCGFFGRYEAWVLGRADLPPAARRALSWLDGRLDADAMRRLNARVQLEGESEAAVARAWLREQGRSPAPAAAGAWEDFLRHTREHLLLVFGALLPAVLAGIPLGVLAAGHGRRGPWILAALGIAQTIPALALLVLLVPLLGIGSAPALAALFLYALLPIVQNTASGLRSLPLPLRESAEVLALPACTRLLRVDLPLASPALLAGVRTAGVQAVGFATLGALIGAGGYGQAILAGLMLNDPALLLLQGALPAAVLALLLQRAFDLLERILVPEGLRLAPEGGTAP